MRRRRLPGPVCRTWSNAISGSRSSFQWSLIQFTQAADATIQRELPLSRICKKLARADCDLFEQHQFQRRQQSPELAEFNGDGFLKDVHVGDEGLLVENS